MDDWVQRPLDELKYWFWRGLASLLWGDNQAGLGLSDMLARLQQVLVTEGFVPAIELVAEGMLGISVPVFTLGLTLFCLILMLMPAMRLNHWVSGRKVIVLLLIVPLAVWCGRGRQPVSADGAAAPRHRHDHLHRRVRLAATSTLATSASRRHRPGKRSACARSHRSIRRSRRRSTRCDHGGLLCAPTMKTSWTRTSRRPAICRMNLQDAVLSPRQRNVQRRPTPRSGTSNSP